ncbi:MAG: putative regulator of cell autolysis [Armatimonadetes bacterium]|jgi:LytS/YehU family sensor histidine kinase|nr:putative regulator of cell autolysis [Armatimonadota bacterium]
MPIATINEFIESTCVIVVIAYLLKRGPMIALLVQERLRRKHIFLLGGALGLAGLVEVGFAADRAPYDTYTLIITFAALRGGWPVGLVTTAGVMVGAAIWQPLSLVRVTLSALAAVGLGALVRSRIPAVNGQSHRTAELVAGSLLAIVLSEAATIVIRLLILGPEHAPFRLSLAVLKVAANGLGVLLLQIIVNDAQMRMEAERLRVEAERNRTLLAETQLAALRARIHPHFLFNTLTSIAGLCRIAPEKAEAATIQLAQITRRALEADARSTVLLTDELDYVRDYLEIEQLRLGSRLTVHWEIEPPDAPDRVRVPPFAVQTLVENAVQHGIAPKWDPGTITLSIRAYPRHVLVSVTDDGVGMDTATRKQALPAEALRGLAAERVERPHGLSLSHEQLNHLYGPLARLRLFSRPEQGTRVAFIIPAPAAQRRAHLAGVAGFGTEQVRGQRERNS